MIRNGLGWTIFASKDADPKGEDFEIPSVKERNETNL